MAKLISVPFRVSTFGGAVSNEQGTDVYYGEQIATIIFTRQGERPLRPLFGVPDPAFEGFAFSTFRAQVAQELPEVENLQVETEAISERQERVNVNFDVLREYT